MSKLTESISTVPISPNTNGDWIDRDLGIIRIQFPIGYSGWSSLQNPESAPDSSADLLGILILPYPVIKIPDDKTKPIGTVKLVGTKHRNRYSDPLGSSMSARSDAVSSSVDPASIRSEMLGGWEDGDSRIVVTSTSVAMGGGSASSPVVSVGEDGKTIIASDRLEIPSNINVAQLSHPNDIFREWIPKTIVTSVVPGPNQFPAITILVKKIGKIIRNMDDITGLANWANTINSAQEGADAAVENLIDKLKRLVD